MSGKKHLANDAVVPPGSGSVVVLDRRQFLKALIAVGATVTVAGRIEEASAAEVDAAWQRVLEEPWYFEVDESGALVDTGAELPERWSDLFELWDLQPRTPEHLIGEVEQVELLKWEFQRRAEERASELRETLDRLKVGSVRHRRLERQLEEISDPDDGWAAWVRQGGKSGIDRFWEIVDEWLDRPVDFGYSDSFPVDWHPQGKALKFFEELGREPCRALGVKIIEGEHPGSTYFAAELRVPVERANAVAAERGYPFRFRAPAGVARHG